MQKKIFVKTLFVCFGIISLITVGKVKAQEKLPLKFYKSNGNKPLIIYISGDGGWNSFSNQLVTGLNNSGYSIIGLDSKKYFWTKKTPQKFSSDLQPIINQYLKEWNKKEIIIIGYSFGADVSSFLPNNLKDLLSKSIKKMVLLSPGYSTSYEVKLIDMLNSGGNSNAENYKVYPEFIKANIPITCIFGNDDDSDFKVGLKESKNINKVIIKGNHHFNDDINLVLKTILNELD